MRVCFLLFLVPLYHAAASFYDQHAQGWHWYEDFKREERKEKFPLQKKPQTSSSVSRLKAFQKQVEALKARAVMDPTFTNVHAYMEIQKELMEKSSRFAQRWLEVLFQRPELDYTLTHPTSQTGRQVYHARKQRDVRARIRALSRTHGLMFFFSNACDYCKAFAPIVQSFARTYGWKVLAVSVDGSSLPEFPGALRDNGAVMRLGVKALPALLAVEPASGSVVPLSYGLNTHDQIEERVRVLLLGKTS